MSIPAHTETPVNPNQAELFFSLSSPASAPPDRKRAGPPISATPSRLRPLLSSARTGTGSDEWRTPPEIFEPLRREFDLELDVASTPENALLPYRLDDGLGDPWDRPAWINPPFSESGRFIERAAIQTGNAPPIPLFGACPVAVMLIPARTDTKAWHRWIFELARKGAVEIRFHEGRVRFLQADGKPGKHCAPFPTAIIIWRGAP